VFGQTSQEPGGASRQREASSSDAAQLCASSSDAAQLCASSSEAAQLCASSSEAAQLCASSSEAAQLCASSSEAAQRSELEQNTSSIRLALCQGQLEPIFAHARSACSAPPMARLSLPTALRVGMAPRHRLREAARRFLWLCARARDASRLLAQRAMWRWKREWRGGRRASPSTRRLRLDGSTALDN
jgi:hypothetical protein